MFDVNEAVDELILEYNDQKYNAIRNELQNRVKNKELTLKEAKELNKIAYNKYVVEKSGFEADDVFPSDSQLSNFPHASLVRKMKQEYVKARSLQRNTDGKSIREAQDKWTDIIHDLDKVFKIVGKQRASKTTAEIQNCQSEMDKLYKKYR